MCDVQVKNFFNKNDLGKSCVNLFLFRLKICTCSVSTRNNVKEGVFNSNFPILSLGTGASLWSEESITWLKCKVSGAKLRAYPTRVESSKLVIIDLFVFPPKNPKNKSPVSSQAGKGLPGLQFSIAQMMILAGMAQRIIPQVNEGARCSSGSSPLSGGSNESSSRSCSSVSIESSVQEGPLCENSCEALSSKDESTYTDNSCSSKETVTQRPEKRPENSTIHNAQFGLETKTSTASAFSEESVIVAKETDNAYPTTSGPNIERENCEDYKGQGHILASGKWK